MEGEGTVSLLGTANEEKKKHIYYATALYTKHGHKFAIRKKLNRK